MHGFRRAIVQTRGNLALQAYGEFCGMKGKATSFDIAYLAGVSQSTVSRALRDSPAVNQETKDKIFAIAKQLNYKVDKNASNLRKQCSGTLALLLFEDPTVDDSQINPFFLSMLGSITRACTKRGHDLLLLFSSLAMTGMLITKTAKKLMALFCLATAITSTTKKSCSNC